MRESIVLGVPKEKQKQNCFYFYLFLGKYDIVSKSRHMSLNFENVWDIDYTFQNIQTI